jgi:hypothetical protein
VSLRHIGPTWRDNVLGDPDALIAAAPG